MNFSNIVVTREQKIKRKHRQRNLGYITACLLCCRKAEKGRNSKRGRQMSLSIFLHLRQNNPKSKL